jgi:hypothetical protein
MASRRITASDQLAAGQPFERVPKCGVRLERRMVDLVDEVEKIVGLHAVLGHQPAHRGAVAPVIVLLQPERLVVADIQKPRDVVADAPVDLLPEIEVMRIERVVEIEDPGGDLREAALFLVPVCGEAVGAGGGC